MEEVIIGKNIAVLDGVVRVHVTKLNSWLTVKAQRHELGTGLTVEPADILVVDIPVEGAQKGGPITPEQAAYVLQTTLRMTIPTATVFVENANEDFTKQENSF